MIIMNFDQDDILDKLDPDENITHFIPQVAKDENFENIIYNPDANEYEFKFFLHIVNILTSENEKYYGRYAIITDKKGLYNWSDTDLAIGLDFDRYSIEDKPPRMRQPLRVLLDYPNNELPYSCFWIKLEEPARRLNEGHIATTWLILDEDNKILFKSIFDKDNLYKIFVDSILPENRVYKIATMQHYANNDSSTFGMELVYTSKSQFTFYVPKQDDDTGTYNNEDKIRVEFIIPPEADKGYLELIKNGIVVHQEETTEYEEDNPEYDDDGLIIARIKSDIDKIYEEWTYRIFIDKRYNSEIEIKNGFTYNLPASLG